MSKKTKKEKSVSELKKEIEKKKKAIEDKMKKDKERLKKYEDNLKKVEEKAALEFANEIMKKYDVSSFAEFEEKYELIKNTKKLYESDVLNEKKDDEKVAKLDEKKENESSAIPEW